MEPKRLYRSERNKIFAGVLGGLGEYFEVDPTLLRLIWLLVVIFTGFVPGILAYIFAIFVMPPHKTKVHEHATGHAHTVSEETPPA